MLKVGDIISINEKLITKGEYYEILKSSIGMFNIKRMLEIRNKKIVRIGSGYNNTISRVEKTYKFEGVNFLVFESEILKENQLELF